MAGSNKVLKIGVIAEETNDIEVLYEYTLKLVAENSFSFNRFVGHGCGALRRKCRAWADNLAKRGCSHIVVIHDSDGGDEKKIRMDLERKLKGVSGLSVVLIPVEEVEAWLLADPEAIKTVFKMRKTPRVSLHPERIHDPKEYLRDLVAKGSKSHYINTIHNKKIAAQQRLDSLDRCPSFSHYPKFLVGAT